MKTKWTVDIMPGIFFGAGYEPKKREWTIAILFFLIESKRVKKTSY